MASLPRIGLVAIAMVAAGCKRGRGSQDAGEVAVHASTEPAAVSDLQRVERAVRGTDPVEREKAIKEIAVHGVKGTMATADGIVLLRGAQGIGAPVEPGAIDPQATLVDAMAIGMKGEYVAVFDEIADGLRPQARERVLVALASKDVPGAAPAMVRILERHAEEDHGPTWAALGTARKGRGQELVELIANPRLRAMAVHVARQHCDRRVIEPEEIADQEVMLVSAYREAVLEPGKEGEAAELVRLFACLPKGSIDTVLREALAMEDPEMALAAAESLIAHRRKVPGAAIERLAAADETRARLFDALRGQRRVRFPSGWRTQEALARSVMVEWVGQQGRHVEEIEAMEIVKTGPVEHHAFRFRTEPDGPWLLGVAGPFISDDAPTTDDHGGTTSEFARASKQKPRALIDEDELEREFGDAGADDF